MSSANRDGSVSVADLVATGVFAVDSNERLSSALGGSLSATGDATVEADTGATGTGDIVWKTDGVERGRIHNAGDLLFTKGVAFNGGGFTNSIDSSLWVAGATRVAPTIASQGIYVQHRVTGDVGAKVHDATASELRLTGISNGTFLNAHEASVVLTGGANTIADTRCITTNLTFSGSPTGTITAAHGIRIQNVGSGGPTITTAYGLYIEQQTRATTNWSLYAPSGNSLMLQLQLDSGSPSSNRAIAYTTGNVLRWLIRANGTAEGGSNAGSDLEIVSRADDGTNIGTVLTITRSTRAIQLGSGPLGFYGATPGNKPTISGSKGANAALASLLSALATLGLLTDSTT